MKSALIPISIILASLLIVAVIIFTGGNSEALDGNNVSIVDGVQIIEIDAKGGYTPRKSVAKAGIPTVLRFNTKGTFDCSLSIRIPSMGISQILPQTGSTDINIPNPESKTLQGMCGMGMYPFEIDFQS